MSEPMVDGEGELSLEQVKILSDQWKYLSDSRPLVADRLWKEIDDLSQRLAEYERPLNCGHLPTMVFVSSEGTAHCQLCEMKAKLAAAEKERDAYKSGMEGNGKSFYDAECALGNALHKLSLYEKWTPEDPEVMECLNWLGNPGNNHIGEEECAKSDRYLDILARVLMDCQVKLAKSEKQRSNLEHQAKARDLHIERIKAKSSRIGDAENRLKMRIRQLEAAVVLGDAGMKIAESNLIKESEVIAPYLSMKSRAEKAEADFETLKKERQWLYDQHAEFREESKKKFDELAAQRDAAREKVKKMQKALIRAQEIECKASCQFLGGFSEIEHSNECVLYSDALVQKEPPA